MYDNWRYALDFASAGYGVLAPDSPAKPAPRARCCFPQTKSLVKSRGRAERKRNNLPGMANGALRSRAAAGGSGGLALSLLASDQYTYWCDDLVYASPCSAFDQDQGWPYCYASDAAAIAREPGGWASYYARVYELRRRACLPRDWSGKNLDAFSRDQ